MVKSLYFMELFPDPLEIPGSLETTILQEDMFSGHTVLLIELTVGVSFVIRCFTLV